MKTIIGLIFIASLLLLLVACRLVSRKNESDAVDDLEGEENPIRGNTVIGKIEPIKW